MQMRSLLSAALLLPTTHAFAIPGLDAYMSQLAAHPLETKIETAAALAVAGDALAQRRPDPNTGVCKPYDTKRAASFVAFDAMYRGGFQHAAFPWIIDRCTGDALLALSNNAIPADLAAAAERTAFNQLLIVPIVYYPLFFAITGAVQGLTVDESVDRAKAQGVDLTLKNWQFWIPAQFVQFEFLPIDLQVPFTCVMGLVWNVILSALAGDATCVAVEESAAPVAAELKSFSDVIADAKGVVEPTVALAGDDATSEAEEETPTTPVN